ncbi:MAG: lysostaphin resistance A-like protein [Cetobacterium sp.]
MVIAGGLIFAVLLVGKLIDKQNKALTLSVLLFVYFAFLIVITLFIKRKKIDTYVLGLCRPVFSKQTRVIYIMMTLPLVYGIVLLWEFYQYISPLYIIWMFLVGITEEILCRGLLRDVFIEQTNKFYVLMSATIFSSLHIITALTSNPTEFSIFIVMLNSFLIGIMLAIVFVVSTSIYPAIIYHILHNIVFFLPLPYINNGVVVIIIMLIIFYLLYSNPETSRLNSDINQNNSDEKNG